MGLSAFYGAAVADEQGIAVIHHAFNNGVTFFDTSDSYGPFTNEKLLGLVLQHTSLCLQFPLQLIINSILSLRSVELACTSS